MKLRRNRIMAGTAYIMSFILACAYLVTAVFCIFNMKVIANRIKDTSDALEGFALLKYSGISYTLTVFGIILCVALSAYRFLLTYYFKRLYTSDDKFYSERFGGLCGFSFLCLLMTAIGIAAAILARRYGFGMKFISLYYIFAVYYFLLAVLPLIEMSVFKIRSGKICKKQIVNTIDNDSEKDEKKVSENDSEQKKNIEKQSSSEEK